MTTAERRAIGSLLAFMALLSSCGDPPAPGDAEHSARAPLERRSALEESDERLAGPDPVVEEAGPAGLSALQIAWEFRRRAALDLDAACARLPEQLSALGDLRKREGHARSRGTWPCFFAGSVVCGGQLRGKRPIVAFYNLVSDAALVTVWRQTDAAFGIESAYATTGAAWIEGRESRATDEPTWRKSGTLAPLAMAERAREVVARFHALYPADSLAEEVPQADPGSDHAFHQAEVFAIHQLAGLRDLTTTPSHAALHRSVDRLQEELIAGDARRIREGLSPEFAVLADGVTGLPERVRRGLRPLLALVNETKAVVVFVNVARPTVLVAADFARPGDPEPAVAAVAAFALDATTQKQDR